MKANYMAVIKTKKLILRPLKKEDAEFIARYANDKIVYRNTLAMPYPYTLKDAKGWIEKNLKWHKQKNPADYTFAIEIDGEYAGAIGIHKIVKGHKAEIGYWLARKHWGKGIMSEAAKAVIGFAFEKFKLKRVYAKAFPWNKASMKVMEKCGMKFEGILKKNVLKKGKFIDEYVFAKVK